MSQPVILHFTPTQQDYANVLRLFFLKRTSTRISLGVLAIAFVLICVVVLTGNTRPSFFEIVWLFLPPLFVLYVFLIQPSRMASKAIKEEQLATEATWEVSENGVKISSRFGSTHMDWDSLLRLISTKDYYLLLSKVNRNAFRFLPRRAFSSTEEQDSFLTLVRNYLPIS